VTCDPVSVPANRQPAAAALQPAELLQALRWRCAIKRFAPALRISQAIWTALEECLHLTPSSFGLQPWKFLVVDDPGRRERLRAVSFGQRQVTDADRLVVFAARKAISAADIDRHLDRTAQVRQVSPDSLASTRRSLLTLLGRTPEEQEAWATRQVYIALGNFLTSAALLGVDACPMEGIDRLQYDLVLGLDTQGYGTRVAVAAGYRAPEDTYSRLSKVRYRRSDVVEHL
jgi:nitroreductase